MSRYIRFTKLKHLIFPNGGSTSFIETLPNLHHKALFTSPVFSPPKDVRICGDLVFTQYPQIPFPKNTLPWWRVFNLAKNTLEWREFVGIFRDYPLKTRTSKQPNGEIPGYKLIPSHPLKYPRSKQGLKVEIKEIAYFQNFFWKASEYITK
jgi:hypothetical protein